MKTAQQNANQKLNLEKIVTYPTWREMLMDLIIKEDFDPWDIDISAITSKYIKQIKEMKTLELQIPANLILAASILLRLKSKSLVFEEEIQEEVDETYLDEDGEPVEIPMLELRTRIPPKRRISLEELLEAMEEVFKEEKQRAERQKKIEIPRKMVIEMPEISMDEQIEKIEKKMNKLKDKKELVLFSALIENDSAEQKIFILLPLLYLQQKGNISLLQEKLFGEIIIHLNKEKNKKEKTKKEEKTKKNKKKVKKRAKRKKYAKKSGKAKNN